MGACHQGLALCSLSWLLLSCAPSGDLAQARKHLAAKKPNQACRILHKLVGRESPRARRLEILRLWIHCNVRGGRLEQVKQEVAELPDGGGKLYARALVQMALSPANLPGAVALLGAAQKRWAGQGEIPYRAGVLLLADHQSARALPLLQRGCQLADTAACAVALAHALLDLGRTEEALVAIRRVPRLHPHPGDVVRGRNFVRRVRKRTQRFPAGVQDRYRAAMDLLTRQDRAGACIKTVDEILLDHPRLAPAHTLLALAHLRLGNRGEAVSAFRKAARLDPLDATNPHYLGVIYQGQNQPRTAAKHFRRALHLDPFHAEAAGRLGKALMAAGSPRKAAEVMDLVLALDGGTPASLRLAGRAHMAAKNLSRAEACFRRLAEAEPKEFEPNLRLAQLLYQRYAKQGNQPRALFTEAAKHAEKAAKVRPEDPELRRLQAVLDTRF